MKIVDTVERKKYHIGNGPLLHGEWRKDGFNRYRKATRHSIPFDQMEIDYPDLKFRVGRDRIMNEFRPDRNGTWDRGAKSDLEKLKFLILNTSQDEIYPSGILLDLIVDRGVTTRRAAHLLLRRLWKKGYLTRYKGMGRMSQSGVWYQVKEWDRWVHGKNMVEPNFHKIVVPGAKHG